jgi:hypothetical protein
LIRKWLEAGVIEDGKRIPAQQGTPQGAVASPLLANIYLHFTCTTYSISGFSTGGKSQGEERLSCYVTLTTVWWALRMYGRREPSWKIFGSG